MSERTGITYAVFDIETSSLYAGDNKTILDDVRTQMATVGIAHGIGGELELTTVHLNEYESYADFMESISTIFTEVKRPCKLITFNGESFDLKVLRTNMVENGISAQVFKQMIHVDVYANMIKPNLHLSRKRGAGTLKTWSERLLGFKYEMSGADFPKLYNAEANQDIVDMLVAYNQDDVRNTWGIYKKLVPFTPSYWLKGRGL